MPGLALGLAIGSALEWGVGGWGGGGYRVMLPLAMVIIPDVVTQIICLGVRVACLIILKWIFFRLS